MLRDDTFLTPEPVAEEPRPDFKRALAGVGDKLRREAGDFYMEFTGLPLAPTAEAFQVGDVVEYTTPDGVVRTGSLRRAHDESSWQVQVDDREVHIVPQLELRPSARTPRHAHRAQVKAALKSTETWRLRRAPEVTDADGKRVALTIEVGSERISDDQVMAYAANLGYEALEASREGPLLRVLAEVHLPEPSPSEPSRGAQPGLEREEIEGTGMPEGHAVWSHLRAAGYQLGAIQDDGDLQVASFTVPRRYIDAQQRVTATLSDDCTPLAGYFELNTTNGELTRFVHTADGTVEAPYSSGAGPQSTRRNYPGGFEDGDYVVKADSEHDAGRGEWATPADYARDHERAHGKPPPQMTGPSQDERAKQERKDKKRQRREPPPQPWMTAEAADSKAKRYYRNYYGPYGKQLTRNIPRRKRSEDEVVRAFLINAGRKPSAAELESCLQVLASDATGLAAFVRQAQMVPARDIVQQLISAGETNEDLKKQLDRAVLSVITQDPSAVLSALDETAYPRLLYGALQGPKGRRLLRMYRDIASESGSGAGPDLGDRALFAPADAPAGEVTEADARAYLEAQGGDFRGMPEQMQKQMIQETMNNPPADLRPSVPAAPPAGGPLMQVPRPRKRKTMRERAKELGRGIRDRLPGQQRDIDRMVQRVEQDEAAEEEARSQILPPRRSAAAGQHNRQKALGLTVRPKLDRVTSQGTYLCIRMVWDPDMCEGMSDQNIRHHLETWMKGFTTLKDEYPDFGFIGQVKFKSFDPIAGMAELLVRSSEGKNYPTETHEVEGKDNDTRA